MNVEVVVRVFREISLEKFNPSRIINKSEPGKISRLRSPEIETMENRELLNSLGAKAFPRFRQLLGFKEQQHQAAWRAFSLRHYTRGYACYTLDGTLLKFSDRKIHDITRVRRS